MDEKVLREKTILNYLIKGFFHVVQLLLCFFWGGERHNPSTFTFGNLTQGSTEILLTTGVSEATYRSYRPDDSFWEVYDFNWHLPRVLKVFSFLAIFPSNRHHQDDIAFLVGNPPKKHHLPLLLESFLEVDPIWMTISLAGSAKYFLP